MKKNKSSTKPQLYRAMKSHFTAEFDAAKATVQVYLNNPVGIGEHTQHVEEMIKQIEKMTNAEDCLHTLEKHLDDNE